MATATAAPGRPDRNHRCTCNGTCGTACRCRSASSQQGTSPRPRTPGPVKPAEGDDSRAQNPRTPTSPARQSAVADRSEQMPRSCRAGYLKATRGKASPRVAIKAFCLECVGWNRQDVQRCTATACPLWMYRPWKPVEEKQRPVAATTGREDRNPHAEHGGSINE